MDPGSKPQAATLRDVSLSAGGLETHLREMADSVARHTGQAYQEALAKYLSSRFGLNIALIGMLDASGENIQSIAMAEDGRLVPNITYPLADTPCCVVVAEESCFYAGRLRELFPDDAWFRQVNAEGYAGVRLQDANGNVIGIVSAISRKPLPDIEKIESFFKLAASRASAELERMRRVEQAEASELRYALAESGTLDGLWDFDMATGEAYYSPRVAELLGLPPEALADRDLYWSRIHPDDIDRVHAARDAHLEHNAPYDLQYRMRHADGTYRWFRGRGKVMRDASGKPVRFAGGVTDVTEGKHYQAQLKAENNWLAKFAATPPIGDLLAVIADTAREIFEGTTFDAWLLDDTGALHVVPGDGDARFDAARVSALLRRLRGQDVIERGFSDWPRPKNDGFDLIRVTVVAIEGIAQRVGLAVSYPAGLPEQAHERQFVAAAERLVRLAMERLRNDADLQRQRLLFENLFECAPDAMVILDQDDRVLNVNSRFTALFNYTIDEVRGRPLNELVVPPEFAHEAQRLSSGAMGGAMVARESFRRRKDGTLVPVAILGAPVTVSGIEASYFAVYRDQSSLHEAAQKLDHQSRHDQLTGLPNRYEFERRLRHALMLSGEGLGYTGVLYFDLDQFKVINDSASHAAGDDLLNEIVKRLRPLIRPPRVLARLGGDEFAVLLVNGRQQDCEQLAVKIRESLADAPFRLDGRTFPVTASFGIVAVQAGAQWDPREVLSLADSACFLAKERGRNRVQVYDPADMGVTQRREEMDWISRINDALEAQRFQLHHQRIVPIDESDTREHHEILLRMLDDDGNTIPPGVFIPPAERYNLMPRIDRWVLQAVFARLHAMGRPAQEGLTVAINISGSTLSDEGLTEYVTRLFEQYDVAPRVVCFEITETAAIANFEDALSFIDVVRGLGCTVALDDFGSGLSSFRYLKQIAPDYLKIDGSFVREIVRSSTDYSMVEAINRIGKTVGIRTVAEFVEDGSILHALRRIGVDYAQGYSLHRPEPWKD